jgi:hypothetical protein
MPELLENAAGRLWLDDHAYSARLLANDTPPLLSVADYLAWRRQAVTLLGSDVIELPLAPLCAAWLDAHPELVAAMGTKQRAVAPLRALLADTSLRTHLAAIASALRLAFAARPLMVVLPSPAYWIGIAGERANVAAGDIGQREIDAGSVYVAEFLRTFGETGIDGIVLRENAAHPPSAPEEISWYGPVFNVAGHFRWKTGVLLPGDTALERVPESVDFAIARSPLRDVTTALLLPPSIWTDDTPPAVGPADFCYAEVPPDTAPERVLKVIDALRNCLTG